MGEDEGFASISIDAGQTRLALAVGEDGRLHQVGFGVDLAPPIEGLPLAIYPLAYPTFGEEPLREPALRITHGDGVVSTRLRFVGHQTEPHDHGHLHRIVLKDRVAPVTITLGYRTWPAYDLLEQWVEVTNDGAEPITVHRAMATAPSFAGAAPQLTHWGGGWAGEWTETTEALTAGTKTIASAGGVRPSLYRAPIVLLATSGPATETEGTVAACTIAWGGDVRFDAEVALHGQVRLLAGHQDRGAERVLDAGETFSSPSAYWVCSNAGIGPTSRALHRFAREHVVRDGTATRATVVNTWEALFFDLDPTGLRTQIDHAAEVGGELFLLDDGWFGTTHARNDDTTGLGDWEVDLVKLPDGLQPLIDHALGRGLRFGLWVEPEMVNPDSDLYGDHPDWVIGEPGRDRREERNQLVLDLCRPEVAAFVVDTIDRLLRDHPGISYLKWDANRDITEPGSASIPEDRQTHLALDRVSATYAVMDEVALRHPDVELMLCASGGGRSDLGTLTRFHELWTSDNTDPIDRIRIQWGASHLLPASVQGAHVTRWGDRPLAFACAVAMSGRFGFDLDLRTLSDDERALAGRAASDYAAIRDLVQHGDLHRLISPVANDRGALAYLDPGTGRAVVFLFVLADSAGEGPPVAAGREAAEERPVVLPWIDPASSWTVTDRTPGRSPGHQAQVRGGTLAWPTGPAPSAVVVELHDRQRS